MTLVIPIDGTGALSIISHVHFQQFSDLLQGVMADTIVKVLQNLELLAIAATPSAPTLNGLVSSSTGVEVGTHLYCVSFMSGDGESLASSTLSVTVTTSNRNVSLQIPASPVGCSAVRVYRSKAGLTTLYLAYTQTNTNAQGSSAFTWVDTIPDASLDTTHSPVSHPSFGGSLILKDSSGNTKLQMNNDGSIVTGNSTLLDPSNGHDTIINAAHTSGTGNLRFQVGGSDQMQIDGSGGKLLNGAGNATILDFSAGTDVTLNSPNSGGGHQIVFTVGGVRVAHIDASGNMVLKGTLTQSGTP